MDAFEKTLKMVHHLAIIVLRIAVSRYSHDETIMEQVKIIRAFYGINDE